MAKAPSITSAFSQLFQSKSKSSLRGVKVPVEDLSTNDVVVAVMGPTGSGKSSFIEMATGISGIAGHTLASCTNQISVIKLSFPGLDLCFVDTPGFDDTNRSDVEILKMISDWLVCTYKKQIHLTGLLYFHRISDNRMAGTSLKNFNLFQQLCGEGFNKIILTTTMWDEVDEEVGQAREEELKSVYWKPMMERGSSAKRFLFSRESAFEILMPIFEEVQRRSALLLQTEMNDQGMRLRETSAGKALYVELTDLVSRHQDLLGKIRNDLKDSSVDQEEQLQYLMSEYQQASMQLQSATEDMRKMKLSVMYRVTGSLNWSRLLRILPTKRKLREAKELAKREREEKELWESRAKEWEARAREEKERRQVREQDFQAQRKEWETQTKQQEEAMRLLEETLAVVETQISALERVLQGNDAILRHRRSLPETKIMD